MITELGVSQAYEFGGDFESKFHRDYIMDQGFIGADTEWDTELAAYRWVDKLRKFQDGFRWSISVIDGLLRSIYLAEVQL